MSPIPSLYAWACDISGENRPSFWFLTWLPTMFQLGAGERMPPDVGQAPSMRRFASQAPCLRLATWTTATTLTAVVLSLLYIFFLPTKAFCFYIPFVLRLACNLYFLLTRLPLIMPQVYHSVPYEEQSHTSSEDASLNEKIEWRTEKTRLSDRIRNVSTSNWAWIIQAVMLSASITFFAVGLCMRSEKSNSIPMTFCTCPGQNS